MTTKKWAIVAVKHDHTAEPLGSDSNRSNAIRRAARYAAKFSIRAQVRHAGEGPRAGEVQWDSASPVPLPRGDRPGVKPLPVEPGSVAAQLREGRDHTGMTVEEIAELVHTTPRTVANWLGGKSEPKGPALHLLRGAGLLD